MCVNVVVLNYLHNTTIVDAISDSVGVVVVVY